MPARRGKGFWVFGVLSVAAVAAGLYWAAAPKGRRAEKVAMAFDANTPLPGLIAALRESNARALAVLFQKTMTKAEDRPVPLTEAEADEWLEAIAALRTGFPKFGSYGRASALTVVGRVFQRFAVEPAPAAWSQALTPAHDLLNSGLADESVDVRVTALAEISRLWGWVPGRAMLAVEEDLLSDWKQGFNAPVVRRLADREPKTRAAAVVCLGNHPVTSVAAQALAYLDDPSSPEVRKQVLVSFARRQALLTEDAVLKMMYDKDPSIPPVAELILKTRGLSQEQISLGSMIFHPRPEIRASLIPLLKGRSDVDPAVWLIQLSRDSDESVRVGAADALAARPSSEVGKRLAEMAATDQSPAVRRAASKHVLPGSETTTALPPLPGSPSLSPKAN